MLRAVDERVTRIRPDHGVEDAKRGRLAGPIRPQQAGDAPVRRTQAHVAHRFDRAEPLGQPVDFDHGAGPDSVVKNGCGRARWVQDVSRPFTVAERDEARHHASHARRADLAVPEIRQHEMQASS